jgi:hypothetical protein
MGCVPHPSRRGEGAAPQDEVPLKPPENEDSFSSMTGHPIL